MYAQSSWTTLNELACSLFFESENLDLESLGHDFLGERLLKALYVKW